MLKKSLIVAGVLLVLLAIALVACSPASPVATTTETPAEPAAPTADVPFISDWQGSAHADAKAEAFNHWNDAGKVDAACAKCHSPAGYVEFLTKGEVTSEIKAPAGVITCTTCHNSATASLTEVTFPSGAKISNLGPEARCMVCHQGRESKVSVDKQIADFNATDPDAVVAPIKGADGKDQAFGFRNIHYLAAAATMYGNEVHGGYEYDGKLYDSKHDHVTGVDTCTACHNPHTTQINLQKCQQCHQDVKTVDDLKNVRENASLMDYDGDGNTEEGMYYEVQGLQQILYTAIQAYAKDVTGTGIVYDEKTYPYFFADADGDNKPDQKDGKTVGYSTWTPRLLKAAYNYQTSIKDPGAFAHGNKYIVELLYDSIADLNTKLASPLDISKLHRDDAGHFAGNTEPFRHWDGAEAGNHVVPGTCSKCHTATGLPQFIKEGTTISNPASNGFQCSTCHDEANWPNRYAIASVTFPSGKTVSYGGTDADGKFVADDANLCISCHQGRESKTSVDKALAAFKDADTPDPKIAFRNIHYFAAGATIFGTEVKGAYEYDGKTYLGQNMHPGDGTLAKCTVCHDVHKLEPKLEICAGCHVGKKLEEIRAPGDTTDYDGDGNTKEGMQGEVDTLEQALYAAIQKYAEGKGGAIEYKASAYPYFFGADGKGYAAWTPRLLRAAFNYQYVQKDPGAFVHNPRYIIQILIDSIADLGGDVSKYTRPEAP